MTNSHISANFIPLITFNSPNISYDNIEKITYINKNHISSYTLTKINDDECITLYLNNSIKNIPDIKLECKYDIQEYKLCKKDNSFGFGVLFNKLIK
jgi:hypothetical protein